MRAEHLMPPVPPALRADLASWSGYRYDGLPVGTHRGLPSPALTVVLSLAGPTEVTVSSDPRQGATAFGALVGGLHTQPAVIAYAGELHGLQLDLTPLGARRLLGVPAGALGPGVLDLGDVIGPEAARLREALHAAPAWSDRFALVTAALERALRQERAPVDPTLTHAWALLTGVRAVPRDMRAHVHVPPRVRDVAAQVGWSRRQLQERFLREFGLTPKQAAQVARFDRTRRALQAQGRAAAAATTASSTAATTAGSAAAAARPSVRGPSLAAVAAQAGYADQAHMAREWNLLAGLPPSRWLAEEELPFVQDDPTAALAA